MLMIRGLSALLLLASQLLPANCMDVAEFGTFSYINSILVVLAFVIIWGTDRYCLKEVSLAFKKSDGEDGSLPSLERRESVSNKLFGVYSILTINTVIVAVGLFFYLRNGLGGEFTKSLFCICVLIVFGRAASQVTSSITRGMDKVLLSEALFSIARPLLFVLPMACFYFAKTAVSLNAVLALFAASFLLVSVFFTIINTRTPQLKPKVDVEAIPKIYRYSFFFFLIGVGLPLMSNINTIELGNLRSRPEVAMFSAAAKVVGVVLLGLVSANLIIAPKLTPLYYGGDFEGMRRTIRGNNLFVIFLTLVPVCSIAIFAESIMATFGAKYVAAAPILRVMVIGQAFSVACGPVVLTATLTGLQKYTATVVLSVCLINWLLCLILIPKYGAMGAAYASVVGNLIINSVLALIIYKRIGVNVTMTNLLPSAN